LGEINELIIQRAAEQKEADENDGDDNSDNSGTMIVDATCAPSDIRYPTDTALLNEARVNSERIIDLLHEAGSGEKPRTYRRRAHKEYTQFVRARKPGQKKIRKCIKKQLGYLGRNLNTIARMQESGKVLPPRWQDRLETLRAVQQQQQQMVQNRTHRVEDRIVSISRPWLRPIVRGKTKSPVEFGAKLDISVVDGYTRLETYSFDAYNEATFLKTVIERYRQRTGKYPQRVLADKLYRNRENLRFCKENSIRLSGPALGRPKKEDTTPDKQQDYADICERVEVERHISLAKRKCGLGLLTTRLQETTASAIALSIVVLNLRKIQCAFFFWLQVCLPQFIFFRLKQKFAFVQ
jgi:hypothetical protein